MLRNQQVRPIWVSKVVSVDEVEILEAVCSDDVSRPSVWKDPAVRFSYDFWMLGNH